MCTLFVPTVCIAHVRNVATVNRRIVERLICRFVFFQCRIVTRAIVCLEPALAVAPADTDYVLCNVGLNTITFVNIDQSLRYRIQKC